MQALNAKDANTFPGTTSSRNRQDIGAWFWPENVFNSDSDIGSDMGKARRLGSQDSLDAEEMFLRMFAKLRQNRVAP